VDDQPKQKRVAATSAPQKRAAAARAPKRPRGAASQSEILDRDVEDLLIATTDIDRVLDRELKAWRGKELSERSLYILYIVERGFNRPNLLINYFGILPSMITVDLDKLEAAGLLRRRPVPSDRRATQLVLTEKGRAVCRNAKIRLNSTFRPRMDNVSPEDLRICIETLRKIVQPLVPPAPRSASND
jgi:DNA-binding MarR family transcriptional regulator